MAFFAIAAPALTGAVLACAVCGAAERSLPSNGTEVPFEGRKRATVDVRAARLETTRRDLEVDEIRTVPAFGVALLPTTLVSVEVPILARSLRVPRNASAPPAAVFAAASSPETTRAMLGDVELRVAHTAFTTGMASLSRRLVLGAGVKVPTAPLEVDPSGREVHPDLQPGCGSIVPLVSVTHTWSSSRWSAWTSASFLLPVSVRDGAHPGSSLRGSVTVQLQPTRAFATRLGVLGRYDSTGVRDEQTAKDSGGASIYVAPEIVVSPVTDLVIGVGASFPVVQEMRGYRATSPVLLASVGLDF